MPSIHVSIRELKQRNPRIRARVVETGQVQRFLSRLGYRGPYDRCKIDVIYFQEDGRQKAMVVWGILGPRADPEG